MATLHHLHIPMLLLALTSSLTWTQPVPMLQLSPEQCRASLTQCPSLGSGTGHADLDSGIAMFKMQYEARLRQLRSYFDRAIDSVIADPSASLGATLCAFLPEEFVHANSRTTSAPSTTTTTTTTKTTSSINTAAMSATMALPRTTTVTAARMWPSQTEPELPTATESATTTPEEPAETTTESQTPEGIVSSTPQRPEMTREPQTTGERGGTDSELLTTEKPGAASELQTTESHAAMAKEPLTTSEPGTTEESETGTPRPITAEISTSEASETTKEPGMVETGKTEEPWTTKEQSRTPEPLASTEPTPANELDTTEEPKLTTMGAGTTEEPMSTKKEPGATEEPVSTKKEPGATEEPMSTKKEPGVTEELTSTKKESGATEEPMSTKKEPGATANTGSEPSTHEPLTTSFEPATTTARLTNIGPMTPTTTSKLSTTILSDRCRVGEWSEWSSPFGFGQQERTREVTVPGDTCPELDQLVEDRDLTVSTDDAGHNLFENITVVGDNFYRDFLRATTSPRDILLIIDASGGLGQRALTARTNALTQIIDMFCGGFGGDSSSNRMGVVKFAYMASGLIQLGDDQSPDLLKEIVGDVRSTYINTCTGKALQMAYTMFDQQFGARPESSATHDTLLITDGKSDCQEDLLALSQRLQTRSNISAIAVGLGNEMEARAELQTVVSNQNPRRIFPLADYMDLEAMMAMLADTRGATADC